MPLRNGLRASRQRASFLPLRPSCRLPSDGVVQVKGGPSHLRRAQFGARGVAQWLRAAFPEGTSLKKKSILKWVFPFQMT